MLLCSAAAVGTAAESPDSAQAKAKLAAVRAHIAELTARLGGELKQRDVLSARLREADLAITAKRKRLDAIRADQAAAERHRSQLRAEQARDETALAAERAALAGQVRAAYMIGRQEELRLLLNQGSPASLGRTLAYYGYFAQERSAKIGAIRDQVSRVDQLTAQIGRQSAALKSLADDAAHEMSDVEQARAERAAALVAISGHLAAGNRQLADLKREEQAVESLVADLARVLEDFPIDRAQSFDRLRGKLPWPVLGRVSVHYQQPHAGSSSGIRWNGVMIETARGAKVRAPFYGRVVYADWLQGLGLLLIIGHSGGYMTLYGHAEVLYKSVGGPGVAGRCDRGSQRRGGRGSAALFRDTGRPKNRGSPCLVESGPVSAAGCRAAGGGSLPHVCWAKVMSTKSNKTSVRMLCLGTALSLSLAGTVLADKAAAPGADLPWADARVLAEVLERVEHEYVNPVDDHQLLQAAIRGMVSSLDPYSAYLDGDEYDEVKISSSGRYSGVGIELSMEDDQVVVVSPFEGSPAAAAGIRTGDIITTIDGVAVNTSTLGDTIGRMRGKEGTSVNIGILREGSSEPLLFTLKRSRVELHSVKSQLLEPGFGYVRISEFSETTGSDLQAALGDLRKHNGAPLKGLVLDLRNNPGGVLEAAVSVADEFLDGGVIVTAKGRTPESQFEMDATPGDALNGAPIVILVNGGSASAAEIVAGALKDHHRATLMGRTTFGKGSVQTVMPLAGDHAIKLTTSLYYTPSGISINHRGIAPDIELERDPNPPAEPAPPAAEPVQNDPQVKRAIQELKAHKIGAGGSVSAAAHLP